MREESLMDDEERILPSFLLTSRKEMKRLPGVDTCCDKRQQTASSGKKARWTLDETKA